METSIRIYCAFENRLHASGAVAFANSGNRFSYEGGWSEIFHDPLETGAGYDAGASLNCIELSDYVFAFIDDIDSYRVVSEIGMAFASDRLVRITFKDQGLMDAMPFQVSIGLCDVSPHWDREFLEEFLSDFHNKRLSEMPYDKYLKTRHWLEIREAAKEAAQHRCQLCNSPTRLEVHHRTYERRGFEELSDLTVLCSPCHGKHHDKTPRHAMENGPVVPKVDKPWPSGDRVGSKYYR